MEAAPARTRLRARRRCGGRAPGLSPGPGAWVPGLRAAAGPGALARVDGDGAGSCSCRTFRGRGSEFRWGRLRADGRPSWVGLGGRGGSEWWRGGGKRWWVCGGCAGLPRRRQEARQTSPARTLAPSGTRGRQRGLQARGAHACDRMVAPPAGHAEAMSQTSVALLTAPPTEAACLASSTAGRCRARVSPPSARPARARATTTQRPPLPLVEHLPRQFPPPSRATR